MIENIPNTAKRPFPLPPPITREEADEGNRLLREIAERETGDPDKCVCGSGFQWLRCPRDLPGCG